jgi:hypothetical protein
MGAWGTGIKDNDTSSDIYADFFDLYNEGQKPSDITDKLISDNKELIHNPDDCNNFWFALALAQWETKSLDSFIFEKVKTIIETGSDLQVWKNLDADQQDIAKRRVILEKFLQKIQIEKSKPKAKEKTKEPIFKGGDCLAFKLNNGNYSGAVVLAADHGTKNGWNLVASTRINQSSKPTLWDFEKSEVLIANFGDWENEPIISWYLPDGFKKKYTDSFEYIGNISVDKKYTPNGSEIKATFSGGWHLIKETTESQFENEKTISMPTRKMAIQELVKDKKWWKIW